MRPSITSFANWWKRNLLSSRSSSGLKSSSSVDSSYFNSPIERTLGVALLLLLFSMPLALGSTVTRPEIWFAHQSALAIIVAAWGLFFITKDRDVSIHPIILLPLAMAGWSALQLIPLPPGLLEMVAPASDRLYHNVLDSVFIYGQGQWRSISMAVPAGVAATIWLLLSSAAALMASYIFSRRRPFRLMAALIGATAVIMIFIGMAHMATRQNSLFGFIATPPLATFFHTTLINNNNAAAYLGMSSLLLLGLSLHETRRQMRLLYATVSGLCAVGVMLTLSRGSILVFFFALLILVGILINGLRARLAVLAFIVVVIFTSLYLASDSITGELGSLADMAQTRAKLNTWQDAAELTWAAPLTGVGYGAYASSVHFFSDSAGAVTRAIFPENIVLQLFGDFGIPLGLVFLLTLFLFFMRLARRSRPSRTMAAASVALIYVLLHDLSDFALMIPAIFFTWCVLTGALTGKVFRQEELRQRLPRIGSTKIGMAFMALAAIHFSLGSWAYANNQQAVQKRMHKAANDTRISESRFESEMKACVSMYPADYYLRLLASEHYRHKGWSSAAMRILHLQKAVELNRINPLPRRLLGRAYMQIGDRARARVEFARALQFAFKDRDLIKDVSLAGFRGRELADMFPRNIEVLRHSTRILRSMGNDNAAATLYEESLTDDAGKDDLVMAACTLAEMSRTDAAERVMARLEKEFPKSNESWQIKAALLASEKKYSEALLAYEKAITAQGVSSAMLLKAADIALRADDLDKVESLLAKVRAHDRESLAQFFHLRGRLNAKKKKYQNALTDFSLAYNHTSSNCNYLIRMAEMNLLLEHVDLAVELYIKAANCAGGRKSLELRRKADELRKTLKHPSND